MLLLCDLCPLSEPQVPRPPQRGLVPRDSQASPTFPPGSMTAREPSSLNGLWGYVTKAVQWVTKTFLHHPCLHTPTFSKTSDGPCPVGQGRSSAVFIVRCPVPCHSTHQLSPHGAVNAIMVTMTACLYFQFPDYFGNLIFRGCDFSESIMHS